MRPPGKLPDRLNISGKRQLLPLLGGLSFFLSAIEYMIPNPLPFLRLGLANLPLLLALDMLPFPSFLTLLCLKVTGQALISGTLFSYVFLFSLGGTGASALLMYGLRKGLGKARISMIGVSAAGAMASNGAQLVLAYFFVFGESIRYVAAPVLALGLFTGTILGLFAEFFIKQSKWYASSAADSLAAPPDFAAEKPERRYGQSFRKTRENFCLNTFNSNELAAAGLCMAPALLFNPDTFGRVIQFLFFLFLAWLSGKKNNAFLTAAVIAGIVFFNLLVPYGEILFSAGPLKVTSGALLGGIRRAATLEALFMLSRCCVRPDISLPGTFGQLVGEAFRVFAVMGEEKKSINRGKTQEKINWAERLDRLLMDAEKKPGKGETAFPRHSGAAKIVPWIILAAAIILAWIPLLYKLL
jgi:heptaprenyl diphosphate synthase